MARRNTLRQDFYKKTLHYWKNEKTDEPNIKYVKFLENKIFVLENELTKESMKQKVRDFFIFHNEANKQTSSVDKYFEEWWESK